MTFIYQGTLYRDTEARGMEFMSKLSWGKWEWKPVKGFAARKIRRIIALRGKV